MHHVAVGDGRWSDEGRQALDDRASEWRAGELVQKLIRAARSVKPEAPALLNPSRGPVGPL
jgi:hypothetical protein